MTKELESILAACKTICEHPYDNDVVLDTDYNGHHIRKYERSLAAVVIDHQVVNMGVINERYPNGHISFQVQQVNMTGLEYVRYLLTGELPSNDPDPAPLPSHTIEGKDIPDCILLENGIHFTRQWMKEQANARPFLPENKLRYWAAQISKSIVIRTTIDGCTHDDRRPTTEAEQDILYKLAYSALLGLNAGETNRQTQAAEDAIVNAIEYTLNLFLPDCNGYLTIYCPLRDVLQEWRDYAPEDLPRIAKDFPEDHQTSTHVEYSDGSEEWLETHYKVSYDGVVFEDDQPNTWNTWHTDDRKLAYEFYDYCEIRGLDPYLTDTHYGVTLHRGDWN